VQNNEGRLLVLGLGETGGNISTKQISQTEPKRVSDSTGMKTGVHLAAKRQRFRIELRKKVRIGRLVKVLSILGACDRRGG
jgi:hypothetical protein